MSDPTTRFFIDRRLSPRDRNLGNRQRFLRRVRDELKRSVNDAVRDIGVGEPLGPKSVKIPAKSLREPRFRLAPGGQNRRVLPGNKQFIVGDRIGRGEQGSGTGGAGEGAGSGGDGEDDFTFTLSRDEFLDIFFDDLALPDLAQTTLRQSCVTTLARAGHSATGSTSNLDVGQTMRRSFGRRLALGRPRSNDLDELRSQLAEVKALEETEENLRRVAELEERLTALEQRWRRIPYIDPNDVRYRRFEQRPTPSTSAVMFCLMDVSGSMDQMRKDLAKRFFLLLHFFLRSHYESVDVVFIRHTTDAAEVDEHTFFHGTATGGTKVSSALLEMAKIIDERYPPEAWNIYAAQASDGDSSPHDTAGCVAILRDVLLPVCQHYAYIEVASRGPYAWLNQAQSQLKPSYDALAAGTANFATASVATPAEIYPVFRRLFHANAEVRSA